MSTMVDPKRLSGGRRFSLKPEIAKALPAVPPLGYKSPPSLIGHKTINPSILALRVRNYNQAYKDLTVRDWNNYVALGIQQFSDPKEYLIQRNKETSTETNLRLARYYRLHLENKKTVDKYLIQLMVGVEAALQYAHPGYFDMSVMDMDAHLLSLKAVSDLANNSDTVDAMDVVSTPPGSPSKPSTPSVDSVSASETAGSVPSTPQKHISPPDSTPPVITESTPPAAVKTVARSAHPHGSSSAEGGMTSASTNISSAASDSGAASASPAISTTGSPATDTTVPAAKTSVNSNLKNSGLPVLVAPVTIHETLRIEARWAPPDFHAIRASTALMYLRLAPILSCFNTEHTWLLEWQTDQLATCPVLPPTQLSKFLSIRIVAVAQQQCIYFSFRLCASGSQFIQVAKSKVLKAAKRGENLKLDPSLIPTTQGEITNIGDILLKDATTTHRGNYLRYLRSEVLPSTTPPFDIKLSHKDPSGIKISMRKTSCHRSCSKSQYVPKWRRYKS